jgi:hypothetical protein
LDLAQLAGSLRTQPPYLVMTCPMSLNLFPMLVEGDWSQYLTPSHE